MSASSLWFSLSFDISIICFIISSGLGWPVAVAGWAAVEPVAVAGDVAGLCANEEAAIDVANTIVASDVKVFMPPNLPPLRIFCPQITQIYTDYLFLISWFPDSLLFGAVAPVNLWFRMKK